MTTVDLSSLPAPSPSGRWFVALSLSQMDFMGVEIAEQTGDGLKPSVTFQTDTFPCDLTWLSDTRATFKELRADTPPNMRGPWTEASKGHFGEASIAYRDGEWIYTPAKD